MTCPVKKEAPSPARYSARSATCFGVPMVPSGVSSRS